MGKNFGKDVNWVPGSLCEKRQILIQDLDSKGNWANVIKLDEDDVKTVIEALSTAGQQIKIAKKEWLKEFTEQQIQLIDEMYKRGAFFWFDRDKADWFRFFFRIYTMEQAEFVVQTFQYLQGKWYGMMQMFDDYTHHVYKRVFTCYPMKMLKYAASISTSVKYQSELDHYTYYSFKNNIHPKYANKQLEFREAIKFIENYPGIYYAIDANGQKTYDFIDMPTRQQARYQRLKHGNRIAFLNFSDWKEYKLNENEL